MWRNGRSWTLGFRQAPERCCCMQSHWSVVLDGREKIEKLRNAILTDIQPQNG